MRRRDRYKGKLFYVVQFIELPFADIDKYVCVPHSWIVPNTRSGENAAVAYPNGENPLTTKDRVKKNEKPNEKWLFYLAITEYGSDTFEDADYWIETQNNDEKFAIESSGKDMKNSKPELMLNREQRSGPLPFTFGPKFDKPSVSVKPYKNPRKPRSRLPVQSKIKKNTDTPQLKLLTIPLVPLNVFTNPVTGVVNYIGDVSEHLNENQLIQSAQTEVVAALDHKTSSEHTSPDFIKRDKSVMSDQTASPELPHENQPSPTEQISKQALSMPDIETGNDEDNHDNDVADHVQSELLMKDALVPRQFPANSQEQVPQTENKSKKSTPLVHHEHSLRLQDEPARQSKESDINPRNQLLQMLTAPSTAPRSSCTQLTRGKYPHSELLPSTRATHQNPQLLGTNGSSTKVSLSHNDQISLSRGFVNNTLSPPYYATNLMNPSAQSLPPSLKKKSSSITKNYLAKRTCFRDVTRNTSTREEPSPSAGRIHLIHNSAVEQAPQFAQKHQEEASRQPISNARSDFGTYGIDLSMPQQGITTSAAQNLSNLAQQTRSLEQSHIQQYLLMQKLHLEQIAHLNSQVEQPHIRHGTDRHAYVPGSINGEFHLQSQPKSISQPNQLLPQDNNQYVPLSRNNMREVLRHETPMASIGGAHTYSAAVIENREKNFHFFAQNSLNQSHYNMENRQHRQDLPRYQNHSGHSIKSMVCPQQTERQGVIRRTHSSALPMPPSQPLFNAQQDYLSRDPRVQMKLIQNSTDYQTLDPIASGNLVDEEVLTTVNAEIQTAPLPDQLGETPSAVLPRNDIAYQKPPIKKLMVDKATEIDPVVDAGECEDEADKASEKSAQEVVDSGSKQQDSPYQETDSESEISSHEEVSDSGKCEDRPRVDTVNASRTLRPQNQQMQQRLVVEKEMLNTYSTLFTEMRASFHYTRDLFNHLRNSVINCADVYETLLEKIEKSHEKGQQISTSLPIEESSRASNENISENSSAENITGISSAPKMKHPQKNKLVLPPEYDPNNPKWTRRYHKKEPGLIELLPRTKVYVRQKKLKYCKRESKDCRTLARMLLTEVFSIKALSVCTLTGGKAKAYKHLNYDVRPGLDEDAKIVLLTFVERYGAKRGWKIDNTQIISSIRTKMQDLRAKQGQAGKT